MSTNKEAADLEWDITGDDTHVFVPVVEKEDGRQQLCVVRDKQNRWNVHLFVDESETWQYLIKIKRADATYVKTTVLGIFQIMEKFQAKVMQDGEVDGCVCYISSFHKEELIKGPVVWTSKGN